MSPPFSCDDKSRTPSDVTRSQFANSALPFSTCINIILFASGSVQSFITVSSSVLSTSSQSRRLYHLVGCKADVLLEPHLEHHDSTTMMMTIYTQVQRLMLDVNVSALCPLTPISCANCYHLPTRCTVPSRPRSLTACLPPRRPPKHDSFVRQRHQTVLHQVCRSAAFLNYFAPRLIVCLLSTYPRAQKLASGASFCEVPLHEVCFMHPSKLCLLAKNHHSTWETNPN